MIIKRTVQSSHSEIESILFDLAICSSGYESRSRFFIEKIRVNAEKKVCLSFTNYREFKARIKNDKAFKDYNYQLISSSADSDIAIWKILEELLKATKKKIINILVDYSCMSRIWYGGVLKYLSFYKHDFTVIKVYFVYSFSEFISPPTLKVYNKYVGPIDGFYQLSIPNKPSAVIIGLGYVESRAYGLAEYFDVEPYFFITDSSVSKDFHKLVLKNNNKILSTIREEKVYYYPLNNLLYTETLLSHLCGDLEDSFRIILAPCGPKPFTLISMITAMRKTGIDVWRISAGQNDIPQDKKASGELSIFQVEFTVE